MTYSFQIREDQFSVPAIDTWVTRTIGTGTGLAPIEFSKEKYLIGFAGQVQQQDISGDDFGVYAQVVLRNINPSMPKLPEPITIAGATSNTVVQNNSLRFDANSTFNFTPLRVLRFNIDYRFVYFQTGAPIVSPIIEIDFQLVFAD